MNNVTFTDEYDICQQFKDCFSITAKKVQETIPDTSTNYDFSNYLIESESTNSLKFYRGAVHEIENKIMSSKSRRSHIPTCSDKILNYTRKLVSPLVT